MLTSNRRIPEIAPSRLRQDNTIWQNEIACSVFFHLPLSLHNRSIFVNNSPDAEVVRSYTRSSPGMHSKTRVLQWCLGHRAYGCRRSRLEAGRSKGRCCSFVAFVLGLFLIAAVKLIHLDFAVASVDRTE